MTNWRKFSKFHKLLLLLASTHTHTLAHKSTNNVVSITPLNRAKNSRTFSTRATNANKSKRKTLDSRLNPPMLVSPHSANKSDFALLTLLSRKMRARINHSGDNHNHNVILVENVLPVILIVFPRASYLLI